MSDTLKVDQVLDKHLQVLRSEDKSLSSLSVSTEGNGARVSGDLEATGYTDNIKLREEAIIKADGNITLDSGGDITLDSHTGIFHFQDAADADDAFKIIVDGGTGATKLQTISDAADGDLKLDSDGDLIFDSGTGKFIAQNNGAEFSAANSAYAGMMIGCSHIFGSDVGGQFVIISTAWENLLWDTDKYALVTFVVPPSNKVKISVHLPYVAAASYQVRLGLATDSSATTLNTKYENDVDDANRSDAFNINYSWVVEGSDHSWSAGQTKTLYIMAYTGNTVRFYTGGTNTSGYGGVIVEATALPATIGDGSEP